MILPTNCFQSWDLILFKHQFCRYVEHLFECEICRVHNGLTIVQVIFSHENCWFHCYSHEHSPNHRMFFSIFGNIWNSFLSFSHLIIHPIHEWSWFYWQFQFCFIVSNDELLRPFLFLRIDVRSPRSVTRCFLVHNGLRDSVVKSFLVRETRSNFAPIARTSQDQFSTLEKTKHGRHGSSNQKLPIGICRYQVAPIAPLSLRWLPGILTSIISLPGAYWSRGWYVRRRPCNKIHHWSRFCCDFVLPLNRVEIVSPLYQSTL